MITVEQIANKVKSKPCDACGRRLNDGEDFHLFVKDGEPAVMHEECARRARLVDLAVSRLSSIRHFLCEKCAVDIPIHNACCEMLDFLDSVREGKMPHRAAEEQ